jgi:hypothetical protein
LRHRPDQDSLYRRPSLYPSAVIKGKITLDKVIVIAKFTRDNSDTDNKLTTSSPVYTPCQGKGCPKGGKG